MAAMNKCLAQSNKSRARTNGLLQWVPLLSLVRVQGGIRGARLKAPPSHPKTTVQHRTGGFYLSLTESERHRSASKREAVTVHQPRITAVTAFRRTTSTPASSARHDHDRHHRRRAAVPASPAWAGAAQQLAYGPTSSGPASDATFNFCNGLANHKR
jgi:hypothetical protein